MRHTSHGCVGCQPEKHALNNGVVTQFVAKRYVDEDVIWFNGRPCKALRAVRNEVLASREPLL